MGIRPETVQRHAGSALRKTKSGKYEARASDTMLRPMVVSRRAVLGKSSLGILHRQRSQPSIRMRSRSSCRPATIPSSTVPRSVTSSTPRATAYRCSPIWTSSNGSAPRASCPSSRSTLGLADGSAAREGPDQGAARQVRAQRRVGDDAACTCGEMRPEALIPGREPADLLRVRRQAAREIDV